MLYCTECQKETRHERSGFEDSHLINFVCPCNMVKSYILYKGPHKILDTIEYMLDDFKSEIESDYDR